MIIKSKYFILRYPKLSDAQDLFICELDKDAKKNFMSTPRNAAEVKVSLAKTINSMKAKKPSEIRFVIEKDDKPIGWVHLTDMHKPFFEHRATISYCLHKDYRGQGITTQAVKLVTNYAFKKYKLKRIVGWCRTFNKASARVLEKSGYKLEGILVKNKCKNGKYLDDMVWAKVK